MAKTKAKEAVKPDKKSSKKGKEPLKLPPAPKTAAPTSSKNDVLLKEILDLGGAEEDLELVKGLDSDAEQDGAVASSSKDKSKSKAEVSINLKFGCGSVLMVEW